MHLIELRVGKGEKQVDQYVGTRVALCTIYMIHTLYYLVLCTALGQIHTQRDVGRGGSGDIWGVLLCL